MSLGRVPLDVGLSYEEGGSSKQNDGFFWDGLKQAVTGEYSQAGVALNEVKVVANGVRRSRAFASAPAPALADEASSLLAAARPHERQLPADERHLALLRRRRLVLCVLFQLAHDSSRRRI